MNYLRKSQLAISLVLFILMNILPNISSARVSFNLEPSRDYEVQYSSAVLLYTEKKYSDALKLIETINIENENQKSLELKALILKDSNRLTESKEVYLYLIRRINEANLNEDVAAFAHFEIAVIDLINKNYHTAKSHFNHSIRGKYNLPASHFLMGVIEYLTANDQAALNHFNFVIRSNTKILMPPAHLYISEIQNRQKNFSESIYNLAQANILINKSEEQTFIKKNESILTQNKLLKDKIRKSIESLNLNPYFKSFVFLIGYDSNVLSVPNSGSIADLYKDKQSNKLTTKALIGKATSAFSSNQTIVSYQFTGVFNDQKNAETGQFLAHDFNYMYLQNPLSANTDIYRLSANSSFQYQHSEVKNKDAFSPYSLGILTAYSKKLRHSHIKQSDIDVEVQYENYLQDEVFFDTMKKTGTSAQIKWLNLYNYLDQYFNPGYGVGAHTNYSSGQEFRNRGLDLYLINNFYINKKNSAALSLHYYNSAFYDRPGLQRTDNTVDIKFDYNYEFKASQKIIFNSNYIANNSNIAELYYYNRWTANMGYLIQF